VFAVIQSKKERLALKQQSSIIFIFVDGLGVGKADSFNPLFRFRPLRKYIPLPIVNNLSEHDDRLLVKGIDACMNIAGIPQSATGQTALFTGVNAAEYLGYHLPAFPCERLVVKINERNIHSDLHRSGLKTTFANAYRPEYFDAVASGNLQHSVTTHTCLASGLILRGMEHYNNGRAIFWDITGEYTGKMSRSPVKKITPEYAGSVICTLSEKYDLVVFETFLTDLIGHSRKMDEAETFCSVFDRFISTIIETMGKRTTVVITSDHGNFEDLSINNHTFNPSLLFAYGVDAPAFSEATSITDITPAIVSVLSERRSTG
jgi:2,3-bisphosphoglycerate-independent phosphoglycerate mutase